MQETSRSFRPETPPPLPNKDKQNEREQLKEKISRMEAERDRLLSLGLDPRSISFGTLIERIARLKAELATGRIASVDVDLDGLEDAAQDVDDTDIISIDKE
jgi:hypothetical protein